MSKKHSSKVKVKFYRRRFVWITLGAIAFVLIAAGATFAYQASKVSSSLKSAADEASILQDQISSGDQTGAKKTLANLQGLTNDARTSSNGFLWEKFSGFPVAGKNVEAVRTVSRVLDDLADNGLPPIVNAADALDLKTFSPKSGAIDVVALLRLAPSVQTANQVLSEGQKDLQGVDEDELISQLKGPIKELKSKVSNAQSAASNASTALAVLPTMLGGQATRNYLLLIQNNAETRATGGVPGAWAQVVASKGKIDLAAQGAGAALAGLPEPALKLSDEEVALYGTNLGTDLRDVNFTPDFPRTAALSRAILKEKTGISVGGVISVDPVALSYILKGTGPVVLEDGTTLNSDNAVDFLLNQVYVDYPDPEVQDAVFASAARKIFEAVSSGVGNPQEVIRGLAKGAHERRLLVWSNYAPEQKILEPTAVGGSLPTEKSSTPYVNMTLNDAAGSKMEYYLDFTTTVKASECTVAGVQTLVATTTLRSDAPTDASLLPPSILGPGYGAKVGTMLLNLRVFAPTGGKITGATINGEETDLYPGTERGRPVTIVTAMLEPGESQDLAVTMTTAAGQDGDVVVGVTPGITRGGNTAKVPTSCK
ncbi:DUF4012 domain-containing protein [soil metagenome]